MTVTWGKSWRYGDISRIHYTAARSFAVEPLRARILVATRQAGGQMAYTGETDEMEFSPQAMDADGTHIYAVGRTGVEKHTQADEPVFAARFEIDGGLGRFIFAQGSYLVVPNGKGGVQTISRTTGDQAASLPGVLSNITAAGYDAASRHLWLFDEQRAQGVSVQVGTAGQLTYGQTFRIPNCRQIVRVLVDTEADLLFVVNTHRIVSLNIEEWDAPVLATDYGVDTRTFTDMAKVDTDQYWLGYSDDLAAANLPHPMGPQIGVYDPVNVEMQIACPRMSLWTILNVIPTVSAEDIDGPPVDILPDPPVITSSLVSEVDAEDPWTYTITATGPGPITFSVTGLPDWATFNPLTGVISGTPMDADTYVIGLTAINDGGSDTEDLTLTVVPLVADLSAVTVGSATSVVYDMMVVDGYLLYVVGDFTTVTDASGTITRNRAACLDFSTGLWTAWNPNMGGTGYCLDTDGVHVYIGGTFTTVGGVTHNRLARVDPTSGAQDSGWTPSVTGTNAQVNDIAVVAGDKIYFATQGSSTLINGSTLVAFGAVDFAGATSSWRVTNNGTHFITLGYGVFIRQDGSDVIWVGDSGIVRSVASGTAYLAYGFGRSARATGNTAQSARSTVSGLGVNDADLYGGYLWIGFANASNDVNTLPANSTPQTNADVAVGFTTSAMALAAAPTATGSSPSSDAVGFDHETGDVFIGGTFTTFAGSARVRLARLTAAGVLQSFAPSFTSGSVTDGPKVIRVSGDAVFVGGFFNGLVQGVAKHTFFAVHKDTGALY